MEMGQQFKEISTIVHNHYPYTRFVGVKYGQPSGRYPEGDEPQGYVEMKRTLDRHYTDDSGRGGGGPGHLFRSYPATDWEVHEMAVKKGAEHIVPSLLGMAARHSLTTSGKLPEASHDLSVHSARMVTHLADLGLTQYPPDAEEEVDEYGDVNSNRNTIDRDRGNGMVDDSISMHDRARDSEYTMHPQDVTHASAVGRHFLRRPKAPKPDQQLGLW